MRVYPELYSKQTILIAFFILVLIVAFAYKKAGLVPILLMLILIALLFFPDGLEFKRATPEQKMAMQYEDLLGIVGELKIYESLSTPGYRAIVTDSEQFINLHSQMTQNQILYCGQNLQILEGWKDKMLFDTRALIYSFDPTRINAAQSGTKEVIVPNLPQFTDLLNRLQTTLDKYVSTVRLQCNREFAKDPSNSSLPSDGSGVLAYNYQSNNVDTSFGTF